MESVKYLDSSFKESNFEHFYNLNLEKETYKKTNRETLQLVTFCQLTQQIPKVPSFHGFLDTIITDDTCIEIYDFEGKLLFGNLKYLKEVSWIEEPRSYDFRELFERDQFTQNSINKEIGAIYADSDLDYKKLTIPEHIVKEKKEGGYSFNMNLDYAIPLYTMNSESATSFIVTCELKRV